ncbi:tuftelin interacting protein [Dorcoceras hygrometricum]|uniref:Tuftelin interacting protein n=1 Tax=Dorcoceras hygrometricum TaxID=472368 RepID=A0A2Z7CQX1_9LAMI|nr:tuftelin interacting protein [Dorcoceras hygrometricum]
MHSPYNSTPGKKIQNELRLASDPQQMDGMMIEHQIHRIKVTIELRSLFHLEELIVAELIRSMMTYITEHNSSSTTISIYH